MARGVRLLLAENTANTSGHQGAFLWEKGNYNCESLAVMSAIILIKNNPLPSFLLLLPLPSVSPLSLSPSLPPSLPPRVAARTHAFMQLVYFVFYCVVSYVQSADQSNVSHSEY